MLKPGAGWPFSGEGFTRSAPGWFENSESLIFQGCVDFDSYLAIAAEIRCGLG